METPVQHAARICKLAMVTAAAVLWSGCAPSVTMTVQVQDAQGNVKSATVTDSDSGPTDVQVAYGDNVTITSSATYRYGLQKFWVEGNKTCPQQNGTILAPPSGNAIPQGIAPAQFTFPVDLGAFNCGYPGEMDLDAAATGNPSPGLFGGSWFAGGPSTTRTQKAKLLIPKGKGK
jgi:hypothetical protein